VKYFPVGALAASLLTLGFTAGTCAQPAQDYRDRLPVDEIIYFLLPDRFENGDTSNDRGGLQGGRLVTGFDPTAKGFYHGGDLRGVTRRLDYVQSLGATAIWLAPVFKNRPVQGSPGHESAGYHGYWITDFSRVDPHFGSNEDMRALIGAAHARGMKVYLDIVVNHTADVIAYRMPTRVPLSIARRFSISTPRRHRRPAHQRRFPRRCCGKSNPGKFCPLDPAGLRLHPIYSAGR
jgi:hypothetical protein